MTDRKEYSKSYREKNKAEIKSKNAAWYQKNKIHHREVGAIWRRNNAEKFAAIKLAWKERNPERRLLHAAKMRARALKVPFDLDVSDIVIPTHCPILGIKLKPGGSGRAKPDCVSLDRFKPSLGYVRGNVTVISWRANCLKRDGTLEEFEKLVAFMWLQRTEALRRNQTSE
jgi:hypothetical protein